MVCKYGSSRPEWSHHVWCYVTSGWEMIFIYKNSLPLSGMKQLLKQVKVDSYMRHIPMCKIFPKELFKSFIISLIPNSLGTRLRLHECRRWITSFQPLSTRIKYTRQYSVKSWESELKYILLVLHILSGCRVVRLRHFNTTCAVRIVGTGCCPVVVAL